MKIKKENKVSTLIKDFKKFISKCNIIDMAVGVIMGSAFSAIVTAFTKILLSVCTWGVPGGLNGLVTVLPALNDAQAGYNPEIGLAQKFDASELQTLAQKLANANYGEAKVIENSNLIASCKTEILGKYTLHGTIYTYNQSAVIDWGVFINAIISFLIIALTLFVIVKIASFVRTKRENFKKKLEAEIYESETPAPVAPAEPPKPSEVDLLIEIRDALKAKTEETKVQ